MKCPFCREGDFAVVDSRRQEDGGFPIRRRRICTRCKRKVWTAEQIEETPLKVVKKNDQRRETFDPAKLRRGLERACYKRPITNEEIGEIARRIQDEVYACYYGEVPSSVIGDLAMDLLKKLDQVAYVRFASVYRKFKDASDFAHEVAPMLKRGKNGPGRRRSRSEDDGKRTDEIKS
ncbi:MAG TPA: transcriptional regulator NrdR [Gemmataceae bacterium]|nr:transcriptional regulator NrdR [Gemmataceae bacterium]